ncbi:MAG: pantetheine-phosphate adenylyltransferase [Candidatus Aenigmarchaeota archaeon]|nr:pantetheine-phosphate adenylyltransferase [Candidatus Aenigmarchaeota archaeon]
MTHVLVGGTFDNLHKGHREIMRKAFEIGDKVLVCVTSDEMAKPKPLSEKIDGYDKRVEKIVGFLRDSGWMGRADIVKIHDPFSEGMRPGLTHIVVSPGTKANAVRINEMRKNRGLEPLEIVEMGWVMARDGRPISDVRVRTGEIDGEGSVKE